MAPSAEVYIEATETDPVVRAEATVRALHQQILDRLTATAREPYDGPDGSCADMVRRHLAAADEALYAPAAGAAATRTLVRALRAAAAVLTARADALDPAAGPGEAAPAARALETACAMHFTVEREVLLPALADVPGIDVPSAVADLRTLLDGGRLERPDVIDVRDIPHGERHPRIFARFAKLAAGEAFTLVNNHDPKPLRREFEATHPGAFRWDYVESGPEQWQVRIGRTADDA